MKVKKLETIYYGNFYFRYKENHNEDYWSILVKRLIFPQTLSLKTAFIFWIPHIAILERERERERERGLFSQ